jgi:hypothetical protein
MLAQQSELSTTEPRMFMLLKRKTMILVCNWRKVASALFVAETGCASGVHLLKRDVLLPAIWTRGS